MVGRGPRPVVLLVNREAGTAEEGRVRAARDVLASQREVETAETAEPEEVDGVVAGLDGRCLVVCGGDGSVSLAVSRLHAADLLDEVTVGIIPLGTGNDLARTLGIPPDPAEAAQVVLADRPRGLDVVVDDDGTVVNAAHAGIGAEAAQRSRPLKDVIGALAYPAGAAAAGLTTGGWALEVVCDGRPVATPRDPLLMVAVANGPTVGGGTAVCPGAVPDDGRCDVLVCGATGPLERARFGAALLEGTHGEREDVAVLRAGHVTVRGEPVAWSVDGEITDPVTARAWHVEPRSWTALVPADRGGPATPGRCGTSPAPVVGPVR